MWGDERMSLRRLVSGGGRRLTPCRRGCPLKINLLGCLKTSGSPVVGPIHCLNEFGAEGGIQPASKKTDRQRQTKRDSWTDKLIEKRRNVIVSFAKRKLTVYTLYLGCSEENMKIHAFSTQQSLYRPHYQQQPIALTTSVATLRKLVHELLRPLHHQNQNQNRYPQDIFISLGLPPG